MLSSRCSLIMHTRAELRVLEGEQEKSHRSSNQKKAQGKVGEANFMRFYEFNETKIMVLSFQG